MASRCRENGFGAALLLILIAVATLSLLTLSERVGLGVRRSSFDLEHEQARELALAGAEHAVWRLEHEPCFLASNQGVTCGDSLEAGSYRYRVSGTSGRVRIEATGMRGGARFSIERRLERMPEPQPALLAYMRKSAAVPAARTGQDGTWEVETPTPALTDPVHWTVLRGSDKRSECLLGSVDGKDDIRLAAWSNGAWTDLGVLSLDGRRETRCFDIAYESSSGDAVIVYRMASDKEVYYRTWDGTSLSAPQALPLPFSSPVYWITLRPHADNDAMTLTVSGGDKSLAAAVWDGSGFAGMELLDKILDQNFPCVASTFIGSSNTALFVWSASSIVRSRTWSGGSWNATTSFVPFVAPSNWLRVEGRRGSTQMLLAAVQTDRKLMVATWNGVQWDPFTVKIITTEAVDSRWRCFDLAFVPDGRALLAYGAAGVAELQGAVWTSAGGWNPAPAGPSLGSEIRFVQLRSDPECNLVHFAVSSKLGSEEQLQVGAWTGAWSGATAAASALSVEMREPFMLALHADACLLP